MSFLIKSNYFILLVIGAACIGLAPIFVRLSELMPSWILFWRMFLALPFLILINLLWNKKFFFVIKEPSQTLLIAFWGSFAFSLDLILWHYSIHITSIANATIIINIAPIFVAMIYFMFFNEKFSIHFFIALITTFIGVFGLIFFSSSYQEGSLYGDLICILAAMFYAIYLVMISRLGHEQALTVIFLTTSFCCFFAFLSGLFENSFVPQAPLNVLEWVNMLSLAIICQVIGVFLITFSIARINASAGSIGLLMQPVTAVLFAAFIFAEYLSLIQIIFALIVFSGIYLARNLTIN